MNKQQAVSAGKAVRINLRSFQKPHMRAFHMTWMAFFVAFFGWFSIAPLMAAIRDDLGLTKSQVGTTVIASVAGTILARLVFGWLLDRVGPRKLYAGLLVVGALPVMLVGLADSYESLLFFRLAIGVVGASFVITQYHTSVMFAPNVVGAANATAAGWGNLGGGVTQVVMPLVLAAVVAVAGVSEAVGWRLAMVIPGVAMIVAGTAYFLLTQDAPGGNYSDLRRGGKSATTPSTRGAFLRAARDRRVWALGVMYGACFGIEITIDNIAALYFHDKFGLSLGMAGLAAGLFGMMNLFGRALGGIVSDRIGVKAGLRGRVWFLGVVLMLEGIGMLVFSRMDLLPLAIASLLGFGLFVKMANGATYSIVPFVNRGSLGSVAGIVGAGGNAGAVAAGFLFRVEGLETSTALAILGATVMAVSGLVFLVQFSMRDEAKHRSAVRAGVALRSAQAASAPVAAAD